MNVKKLNKYLIKKRAVKIILHLILILISVTMLIPFLWMVVSSLKTNNEMFAIPPKWLPEHWAFENYVYMFSAAPWMKYFFNTVWITAMTILGQIFICSMGAYSFARLNFKGKNTFFFIYLGTMMIPFQVVMIPQFKIVNAMGLNDTHTSLILLGIFNAFSTFLLRQFFLGLV